MEDAAPRLAAALAYYALFSLGPLLVIVIAVAGLFFEKNAVSAEIGGQLQALFGEKTAQTIQTMLVNQSHGSSVVATALGIVALVFGATGVFAQLQDALNTIWEVKPRPGQGLWVYIRSRFLSFAMVLVIAFLLLVSMVISTLLAAFSGYLSRIFPVHEVVLHLLHYGVSFLVITLLFALIFKVLPDATVRWRDVWVGAVGTSLLFTTGKIVLAYYLGRESVNSAYGAAGSVVVLLLWVYYSALILFFGAEFTQVYAKQLGAGIRPSPNAVPVTEVQRAQEGIPHQAGQTSPQSRPLAEVNVRNASNGAHGMDAPDQARSLSMVASALGAGFIWGWIAHSKRRQRRL